MDKHNKECERLQENVIIDHQNEQTFERNNEQNAVNAQENENDDDTEKEISDFYEIEAEDHPKNQRQMRDRESLKKPQRFEDFAMYAAVNVLEIQISSEQQR